MSASRTTKASAPGLARVKAAVERKGWRKTSPALLDAACVSGATLKRFWRGIAIDTGSFKAICEAVNLGIDEVVAIAQEPAQASAQTTVRSLEKFTGASRAAHSTATTEPSSYDDIWVGRTELVQRLQQQLSNDTRLLSLTGFMGIGKTALARYLACGLKREGYTCIHLSCDQANPPTLASIAHILSQQLRETGGLGRVELSLQGLVAHLTERKYLLIIDAVEELLSHSATSGWSQFQSSIWPMFFQELLSAEHCCSRFIVTAQDISHELEGLGDRWPQRWCAQTLLGLDLTEQIALFAQLGLAPAPESAEYGWLSQIGEAYAGHPLALRAIARDITTRFDSNITAYLNDSQPFIYPQGGWSNLHNHSKHLRQQVQPRLSQTMERLGHQLPHAYRLLTAGANSQSLPKFSHHWVQVAQSCLAADPDSDPMQPAYTEPGQVRLLLDMLCDRAFLTPTITENRLHFALHPLVQSFLQTHSA